MKSCSSGRTSPSLRASRTSVAPVPSRREAAAELRALGGEATHLGGTLLEGVLSPDVRLHRPVVEEAHEREGGHGHEPGATASSHGPPLNAGASHAVRFARSLVLPSRRDMPASPLGRDVDLDHVRRAGRVHVRPGRDHDAVAGSMSPGPRAASSDRLHSSSTFWHSRSGATHAPLEASAGRRARRA